MPTPAELLTSVHSLARELTLLAIVWHMIIALFGGLLVLGWRPSVRAATALLAAPALSVGLAAIWSGNPFNGTSFVLLAVLLVIVGFRRSGARAARGPSWALALGIASILFGWCYPHFVDGPWYRALIMAPVGVIPCPTLAVIAGFALAAGGFGSAKVPALLAAWTAFYAAFGIFRLGVLLDLGLAVATCGLIALIVVDVRARGRERSSAAVRPAHAGSLS